MRVFSDIVIVTNSIDFINHSRAGFSAINYKTGKFATAKIIVDKRKYQPCRHFIRWTWKRIMEGKFTRIVRLANLGWVANAASCQ